MKGYEVYSKIQQLKSLGFKRAAVANRLNVNWRTVQRYWGMSPEEFESSLREVRRSGDLEDHRNIILSWLKNYPSMTAAQVSDWLKEHYAVNAKDRTVSRFVKQLRVQYDIKKVKQEREFEAVEELPPGYQMQADFGEKWMSTVDGTKVKVRFVAFVLSNSRLKYVHLQTRPFTATDFIRACKDFFVYIGGVPAEIVLDQDSLVAVSENAGDIIFTYEFEKFRQEVNLKVFLCKASDPQSKGKIESVVKYVKNNFLAHRTFVDELALNATCREWLERTANAKVHGTTKRVPREAFLQESEHLRPFGGPEDTASRGRERLVHKDNTVHYSSNRYSVPMGTYSSQRTVLVREEDDMLRIHTVLGDLICEHRIPPGKGLLVKNTAHSRDRTSGLDTLHDELNELLDWQAEDFLQRIRVEKSRYARDQFLMLRALQEAYGREAVLDAIAFCEQSDLHGSTYARDYLKHKHALAEQVMQVEPRLPVDNPKYHITTEKRPLADYARAGQ